MLPWLAAIACGVVVSALQYGRSAVARRTMPLAVLRALAVTVIVALLLDAPAGGASAPAPLVALDASESFTRGRGRDGACWRAALDSATRAGGIGTRFGETLREDGSRTAPLDRASALRPVADRAAATGRPVVVVTDGELDDGELLATLPRGSRAVVVPCAAAPDVAIAMVDAPHAMLAGDTATARVTLVAGARGGPAGRLDLRLDTLVLASVAVPPFAAFGEHAIDLRVVAAGRERGAVLRAEFRGAGDGEPRNDTLSLGVDVTRAPAAVFVSTSPDFDAREALAALRAVTSLPTRAYYRVAVGAWRIDGTLARVDEAEVRAAVQGAPLVVLHGDSAVFGPPRAATRGSLLLFAPPAGDEGEWLPSGAPASPLGASMATLPLDSLAPLNVASPGAMPRGAWQGLMVRRGGSQADRRVALAGWDEPRRIAVLGATGLWRWRFRGGAGADAYAAFFGALYDWMAAGRSDRRAVVPDATPQRAGQPIRWRRGAPADSVVKVVLRRRDATARVQTVTLRFADGATMGESAPLPPGIYDATLPGGSALVAVNASRELVPRRPTVRSGAVGGAPAPGDAPLLRTFGWVYGLVIAALCAEWMLRRKAGLR